MARILLADDETAMRDALKASLAADGHAVTTADNGAEALALLEANIAAFDLLLSDVQMPELDGLSLAARAFALSPTLAVVLMSGYAEGFKRAEALKPRLSGVLPKPVSREALRAAVAAAMA